MDDVGSSSVFSVPRLGSVCACMYALYHVSITSPIPSFYTPTARALLRVWPTSRTKMGSLELRALARLNRNVKFW